MSAVEEHLCTCEYEIVNREQFDHETAFRCEVLLCNEDEGGFSVHCLNLPGVISQGDTEVEAIENIGDAFRETIRYYREAGIPIPWGNVEVDQAGRKKSVVVRI